MSPTQRSLKHLRDQGYMAEVVERWVPRVNIRKDLFGVIDILALPEDGTPVYVQTTTGSNRAARRTKMLDCEALPRMQAKGRVLLHAWRKNTKNRWVLTEEEVRA
ncbi:hypothetical protein HBA54_04265 [Pelagibius litoralis]|uniref:Uncharacterized protein n=1 Tax=Pelagibius litoralis TaxID=374515 RepID=A0A967C740_9PROT|nr:hypothetical protein [Pelagibius litoralis]NIA67797.1 hypothetical protein [Pelagibius litoralis]